VGLILGISVAVVVLGVIGYDLYRRRRAAA
jgi:hypothetical protein